MSESNHISDVGKKLVDVIAAEFSAAFKTVSKFPKIPRALQLPACFIELDDPAGVDTVNTKEIDVDHRWNIYLIAAPEKADATENIIILASQVASYVNQLRRVNPSCSNFKIISIEREHFKPELETLLAWKVEVSVNITDGYNVYEVTAQDIQPSDREVHFNFDGTGGAGNEGNYEEVTS
ncbi:MAG: hypothetical protein NE330_13775 [Lentisphaeraceae bacterium]|nr:hypothetical protein [Lentisphaeraceae bacterium]